MGSKAQVPGTLTTGVEQYVVGSVSKLAEDVPSIHVSKVVDVPTPPSQQPADGTPDSAARVSCRLVSKPCLYPPLIVNSWQAPPRELVASAHVVLALVHVFVGVSTTL